MAWSCSDAPPSRSSSPSAHFLLRRGAAEGNDDTDDSMSEASASTSATEALQNAAELCRQLVEASADLPQVRRRKQAWQPADETKALNKTCTNCRRLKMRCEAPEDGSTCARCKSGGKECVYMVKQKPGRRFKARTEDFGETARELQDQLAAALKALKVDLPPAPSLLSARTSDDSDMSEEEVDLLQNPLALLASASVDSPAGSHTGPHRVTGKGKGKEREESTVQRHLERGLYAPYPDYGPEVDPVTMGLIRADEAERLVGFFFDHLEDFLFQLDRDVHTVAYLRASSPFLFTAVCAASAQYDPFSRSIAANLSAHALRLAARCWENGFRSIDIIQGLCIQVHWAPPPVQGENDRCWAWLGAATRMAAELRLDRLPACGMYPDALEEKLEACTYQTYLILFVMDVAFSIQSGRARSILGDAATLSPAPYAPDAPRDRLYNPRANVAQRQIFIKYMQMAATASTSSMSRDAYVKAWSGEFDTWKQEWPMASPYLLVILHSTRITLFCYSLRFKGTRSAILGRCEEDARLVLSLLDDWDKYSESRLPYGSNMLSHHLSYTATVLLRLLGPKGSAQAEGSNEVIFALTRKTIEICQSLSAARLHSPSFAAPHAQRLQQLLDHAKGAVTSDFSLPPQQQVPSVDTSLPTMLPPAAAALPTSDLATTDYWPTLSMGFDYSSSNAFPFLDEDWLWPGLYSADEQTLFPLGQPNLGS